MKFEQIYFNGASLTRQGLYLPVWQNRFWVAKYQTVLKQTFVNTSTNGVPQLNWITLVCVCWCKRYLICLKKLWWQRAKVGKRGQTHHNHCLFSLGVGGCGGGGGRVGEGRDWKGGGGSWQGQRASSTPIIHSLFLHTVPGILKWTFLPFLFLLFFFLSSFISLSLALSRPGPLCQFTWWWWHYVQIIYMYTQSLLLQISPYLEKHLG